MTINPSEPLSLWALLAIMAGSIMWLLPVLMWWRQRKDNRERDSVTALSLLIEEPRIKEKLAGLFVVTVSLAIKAHDEAVYAHLAALQRYPDSKEFTGGLQSLRAELSGLRDLIQLNEQHRVEDLTQFRSDFESLKKNVARAIGKGEEG